MEWVGRAAEPALILRISTMYFIQAFLYLAPSPLLLSLICLRPHLLSPSFCLPLLLSLSPISASSPPSLTQPERTPATCRTIHISSRNFIISKLLYLRPFWLRTFHCEDENSQRGDISAPTTNTPHRQPTESGELADKA